MCTEDQIKKHHEVDLSVQPTMSFSESGNENIVSPNGSSSSDGGSSKNFGKVYKLYLNTLYFFV